jgi:hypothetical protein
MELTSLLGRQFVLKIVGLTASKKLYKIVLMQYQILLAFTL